MGLGRTLLFRAR